MENISSDPSFLRRIDLSDKSFFHVSGTAHTQNTPIYGSENPDNFGIMRNNSKHNCLVCYTCQKNATSILHFSQNNTGKRLYPNAEYLFLARVGNFSIKCALTMRLEEIDNCSINWKDLLSSPCIKTSNYH